MSDTVRKLVPYLRQIEILAAKGDMEAIKREVHLALRLCGTGAGVSQPAEAPK